VNSCFSESVIEYKARVVAESEAEKHTSGYIKMLSANNVITNSVLLKKLLENWPSVDYHRMRARSLPNSERDDLLSNYAEG